MALFDKSKENKDATETPTLDAPGVSAPAELVQALEGLQQEWNIFQTRLTTLSEGIKGGATKVATKKALGHAKHAAMCVRDALKEFGRVTL